MPLTWLCKKQHAVSHSSTESEVIALDTAVRLEGLPALNFMDAALEIFEPRPATKNPKGNPKGPCVIDPWGVDHVDSMGQHIAQRAKLLVLEDNDAVIALSLIHI